MKMSTLYTNLVSLRKKGFLYIDDDSMTYLHPKFSKEIKLMLNNFASGKEHTFKLNIKTDGSTGTES